MIPSFHAPIRALLVNIPDPARSGKGYGIPLGLAYVAAALERAGAAVKVLDLAQTKTMATWHYMGSTPWAIEEIRAFRPELAGFTGTTFARYNFGHWAAAVKRLAPGCRIAVGGPHVTFEAEATLRAFSEIDACVVGEGEVTARALAEAVAAGRDFDGIEGLVWRADGEIRKNALRPPLEDLDDLPLPARHLFNLAGYDISIAEFDRGATVTLMTSRGCVARCKFCATPGIFPRYRTRSPGHVLAEVERVLTDYPQVENLLFYDDTMTADEDRLRALVEGFKKASRPFRWACWSRADVIEDSLLDAMRESGCSVISFGVESGSPRMLKAIGKGVTAEKALAAILTTRAHGITPRATFISGLPGETLEDAEMTLEFIRRSGLGRSASISPGGGLRYYPGSRWTEEFLKNYPGFDWMNPPPGPDYHRDEEGRPLAPIHRFPPKEIRYLREELWKIWNPAPPLWWRALRAAARKLGVKTP
ncbi:MAG: radical SAM protein [Planctomycetota bacterium]